MIHGTQLDAAIDVDRFHAITYCGRFDMVNRVNVPNPEVDCIISALN